MRIPLRRQILLPVAALVAAAVASVSAVAAWRAVDAVDRRIDAHLSGVADVLLHGGFPLTDSVLRQAGALAGADFVCLDDSGVVRAAGSDAAAKLADLVDVAADRQVVRAADGTEYWHRRADRPARREGETALRLHIFYPQQLRRQLLGEAVVPTVLVGLTALAVACGLSYVLAGRILRPLAAVREHFARLGRGSYVALARPQRNDEIRDLVDSANLLAAQLEERTQAIERSERSAVLGQLSGGLCHHLRNAAAGAKLAVQLHQRRCTGDDAESLDVAARQLDLIVRYLQQLLTLGKPQWPRLSEVDVDQLIVDAAALVEPTFRHRGVRLKVEASAGGVVLPQADAELLRQALVNLLLNAVEAAGESGWTTLACDMNDREVQLTVSDGGPGPPPEVADRLFEPFVTSKPDGVGLGLAASRRIVEQHGGTLTFSAAPHTRFEMRLPRVAPAAADVQARSFASAVERSSV